MRSTIRLLQRLTGILCLSLLAPTEVARAEDAVDPMLSHHHHHRNLLFSLQRSNVAVASGEWHNADTWKDRKLPQDGAVVMIRKGVEVTVRREETTKIRLIQVAGSLKFARNSNTRLIVETIVVDHHGLLEIGSETAPVELGKQAEIVFHNYLGQAVVANQDDDEALRRGLIAMGSVRLFGAAKTSYAVAGQEVRAGMNAIELAAPPVGWAKDDLIVVAGTRYNQGKTGLLENEVRRIASVAGRILTLDRALDKDHLLGLGMRVHIGNLTRNIVIRSENIETLRRGHVMLMGCDGTAVSNARFQELGRTDKKKLLSDAVVDAATGAVKPGLNQRGRYALHFHKCGLEAGAVDVRGSVVDGTPGWGFVNHASRVNFTQNIVHDFVGAGFVAEDGNELGSFIGNFAVGGKGIGPNELRRSYTKGGNPRVDEADFAFHGDAFWFQSPMLEVVGNIAAGSRGVGFFYHPQGINKDGHVGFPQAMLPDPAYFGRRPGHEIRHWSDSAQSLLPGDLPLLKFDRNVAYGNFIGLKIRWLQSESLNLLSHFDAERSEEEKVIPLIVGDVDVTEYLPYVISNSKFWNNFVGVHTSYTRYGELRNVMIGTDSAVRTPTFDEKNIKIMNQQWVGLEGWHVREMRLNGVEIVGYPIGVLQQEEGMHIQARPVQSFGVDHLWIIGFSKEMRQ